MELSIEKDEKLSLRLPKQLLKRIDECCSTSGLSRSGFVRGYLEHLVYTDKAYASFMIRQKTLEKAFWEYELVKAEERQARDRVRQVTL